MTEKVKIPIIDLYGENAINLATEEIQRLEFGSNIPFDTKYIQLGISFLNLKANEILEGKKRHCELSALISESFGEAAVYKYNFNGGVL